VGSKLVDAVLKRAADLTDTVYLRTTSPVFFERKGFTKLQNSEKKNIWKIAPGVISMIFAGRQ